MRLCERTQGRRRAELCLQRLGLPLDMPNVSVDRQRVLSVERRRFGYRPIR
jgi:hypothetical protein